MVANWLVSTCLLPHFRGPLNHRNGTWVSSETKSFSWFLWESSSVSLWLIGRPIFKFSRSSQHLNFVHLLTIEVRDDLEWIRLEYTSISVKPRANALDLSTVQTLNMLSVCWGVVERGVQMTSTMTQYVEHSEDFTKTHVESWLRIWGIFTPSEHENSWLHF